MKKEKKSGQWLCPRCGGIYLAIYEDPRRQGKPLYNCEGCGGFFDRIELDFRKTGGVAKSDVLEALKGRVTGYQKVSGPVVCKQSLKSWCKAKTGDNR